MEEHEKTREMLFELQHNNTHGIQQKKKNKNEDEYNGRKTNGITQNNIFILEMVEKSA